MSDDTLTSTLLLERDEVDALLRDPYSGVDQLLLDRFEVLNEAGRFYNSFTIIVIIVNRSQDTLVIDEATTPWGGSLQITATDLAAGTPQLRGVITEYAPDSAIAGLWVIGRSSSAPSFVAKMHRAGSGGGSPIYVGADIYTLPITMSVAVAADADHGDATAFYRSFLQGSASGKTTATSGPATVTGVRIDLNRFAVGDDRLAQGSGMTYGWLVVAEIS